MASTGTQDTVTVTAHCLCKTHVFTTTVPKAKLPLNASVCHCDSCRHNTGALYSIGAAWPEPRASVDVSNLKVFHFGKSADVLFCSTCSTPMFFANPQDTDEELEVFVGTIQNDPENIVRINRHIFVGDTKDGGATMWMRKPNVDGTEVKRWKIRTRMVHEQPPEEIPFDWPSPTSLTGYDAKVDVSIPIRCKCKGVDFVWHRGNYVGKKKEELPWFIDPTTHKPVAAICGCDSCRLSSGIDLWTWSFAELENISFTDTSTGKSFPKSSSDLKALVDRKDPSIGTLTYYASSSDVQRYFCSNCSACIFYAVDDRPEIVDVAVGALEASDGARAEGFLSWSFGAVGCIEDSDGGWRRGLFDRVVKESEEWRISRGYPKNWRRLAREEAEGKA